MSTLPHPSSPEGNGARPAGRSPRPDTAGSGPSGPAQGVSRLDRITLQLGVTVAVVIAVCSYAVSATSLYALGVQAGYGWLLVGCGTLASIGGNVAHAHPNLVAQAIAAAIPLAVLAMLEGLKGDAGEVTRLTAQAAAGDGTGTLVQPVQRSQTTT